MRSPPRWGVNLKRSRSNLQRKLLSLLASHRDPESDVAGSTYLVRGGMRFSGDIDIFHDREDRVARAAAEDVATQQSEGLGVTWQRREPLFYQAIVDDSIKNTRLEWVVDSDFRFFPTVQDPDFGYVPHPVDLATDRKSVV